MAAVAAVGVRYLLAMLVWLSPVSCVLLWQV